MKQIIETIDDVLPFIREGSGIIVSKRPDHTVIDYVFSTDETFDTSMSLECRGLKFDSDGKLIGRPFHKFFNLGEREPMDAVDWSAPHLVMDKLDGSMVHPVLLNGGIVFMTRMGATAQAAKAAAVASQGVWTLSRACLDAGKTPIFEYTGPENRVVIAYEKPQLTLLGVRDIVAGDYMPHSDLATLGADHDVPVVQTFACVTDIKSFHKEARGLEGVEGFVIAFEDGHRIKLKADGYVLRHRALSGAHLEKTVFAWVVNEAVDDVLPLLSQELVEHVQRYQKEVETGIERRVQEVQAFYEVHKELPRRDFAAAAQQKLEKPFVGAAFGVLDGKRARDMILKHLLLASRSQPRIDEVRPFYKFHWSAEELTPIDVE